MVALAWYFYLPLFVITLLEVMATTIFMHRCLTHRAITMNPVLILFFRFVCWFAGVKPWEWVAVHRKHHALSDREGDPHSPILYGYTRVFLINWWLYHKAVPKALDEYGGNWQSRRDRLDRQLFSHAPWGPVVLGLMAAAWFAAFGHGWASVTWAALFIGVKIVFYLMIGGAVNAFNHHAKHRDPETDDYSSNNQLVSLGTLGEGLHHNHHLMPQRANFALRGWRECLRDHKWPEIDPGYLLVIQPLRLVGLVRINRTS